MVFTFLKDTYINIHELKKAWKALIVKLHPDAGGTDQQVIQLNKEYETIFHNLKANQTQTKENKHHEVDDQFREKLQAIIFCQGLIIELVGSWLWVSGQTLKYSSILRQNGFKWSNTRKMWYWRPGEARCGRASKGSFQDIKNTYGCEGFQTQEAEGLKTSKRSSSSDYKSRTTKDYSSKYKKVGL